MNEPRGADPTVLDRIEAMGVVPVAAIDRVEHAVDLGAALASGGLPGIEVTFRTPAAAAAIAALVSARPDLLVGAGTVMNAAQASDAVDAGARFLVSPAFDAEVVDWCLSEGHPIFPGVMSPTEVNTAARRGLRVVKFFPAEPAGGIRTIRALQPVFPGVRFVPTGGIDAENLADYLRLPSVVACGGSWVAPVDLIAQGRFEEIERLAAEAASIVRSARPGS